MYEYRKENLGVYDGGFQMRILVILVCIFFPLFCSYADENIVLYNTGKKDQDAWSLLKKYFDSKDYNVIVYEKPESFEKHLENAARINKIKNSLLLAIDFRIGEKNNIFIAVTNSKKGRGKFFTIEEVSSQHIARSIELAECIATSSGRTFKELPLLPLLGIDMPGVFLRMECAKDKTDETLNMINNCLQKYFRRGIKNEK